MFPLPNIHWIVLVIISTLFGAFALISKKKGLAHEHSLEYLGTFKFFEFLIILPFLPLIELGYSLQTYTVLYLLSIAITAGLYYQARGFKHIPFNKALPLFELRTIVTLLTAMFFLGEVLSLAQLSGIILIFVALYNIEFYGSFKSTLRMFLSSRGLHAALIAVLILGTTIVFEKKILLETNVFSYLAIMYAFSLMNTMIALTLLYDGYKGVIHGVRKEGWLIFKAAVYSTFSNIFFLAALTTAHVALAEAVRKTSSVIAMFFGRKYFHDRHFKKRVAWTMVAVVGALLLL